MRVLAAATRRRALLGLGPVAALPAAALAQPGPAWPSRPVRYIEPFSAGAASDLVSRQWSAAMAELTGLPFVVENRAGAGGRIAAQAIARAAPDGHTIGLNGSGLLVLAPLLYRSLPYDPARDFTYISGLFREPVVIYANNSLPVRDIGELVDLLRRQPDRYIYGHPGLGSSMHLGMELFKQRAGLQTGQAPYNGPQWMLDLMAGRLMLGSSVLSAGLGPVREGKIRALAVTSRDRNPLLPEVPALSELLPGFDWAVWTVVAGPAGIPPAMVARMREAAAKVLQRPDFVTGLSQRGSTPWPVDPATLEPYRREQMALIEPVIRAAGVQLE